MNVACNGFEIDEKKRVTVCDEGEVVLFTPPVGGKVTEIYVTVLPKQIGTGDPAPSNIRPIEGYDRAVIHHLTDIRDVDYVSDLGEVVYAGTIDLEKGIVTTEYAILNIDGSKTVGAVTGRPNSFTYSLGASCIAPNTRGEQSIGWCTHYKVLTDLTATQFYAEDKVVAYANTSLSAVVGRAVFTDTDYSSAADFKTFLQDQAANGTPVQMVFRLEEPVTFECEALSIRTVSGINYLVSEDGIIHACLEYFEETEEPTESVTMPFGCQIGCTVSEYHTVEPLPVEEREPKDVCPPGMPNKWDIDDIPHAEGYCEGQGMDCVCNPMAIVTGIPCYKTIFVDTLPEEGMSGVMYVTPVGDKYAVYMWDGNEFYAVTASPVLVPLTVTPSPSAQDIDPVGADGFSSVHVDAEPTGNILFPEAEYFENLLIGYLRIKCGVDVAGYIPVSTLFDDIRLMDVLPTENPKTVTPTTSEQVAVDANKWTKGQIKVAAMPEGEAVTPETTYSISPTMSVSNSGLVTANAIRLEHITPSVTPGYVAQGTQGDVHISVLGTKQLPTQAAKTVTPTTSQQVAVDTGKYTTGQVLVDPIPPEYIIPTGTKQINANGTGIDVAVYEKVDVNVPASGKAVQIDNTNHRISSTAYVDTGAKITVAKAGTYTVYYSAFRSSTSGTSGTQIYKNGVAQGTANTTWENSYNQSPHTTMTLAVDDVITVYARSRNTSYYTCVSNLTIVEQ